VKKFGLKEQLHSLLLFFLSFFLLDQGEMVKILDKVTALSHSSSSQSPRGKTQRGHCVAGECFHLPDAPSAASSQFPGISGLKEITERGKGCAFDCGW